MREIRLSAALVLITFFSELSLLLFSVGYSFFSRKPPYEWLASVGILLIATGTFFSILQEKKF